MPTPVSDVSVPRRSIPRVARAAGLLAAAAALTIVAGNLAILAASAWAGQTTPGQAVPAVEGIDKLEAVDERLWRGAAPSEEGYRSLATAGVAAVVDLRAEPYAAGDVQAAQALGMRAVHLPIRDGQAPSPEQVKAFLGVMDETDGVVFVHCGAGVGRTSTMVGSWLVSQGELNPAGAIRHNLSVGPPSLEQIAFVAGLSGDPSAIGRPNALVTAVSRVLDAPRRIWHLINL